MADGPEGLSPLDEQTGGITRRQALKKGALLGGALAWATPVVQVIGMQPALAQTVSPGCQVTVQLTSPTGPVIACITYPQSLCDCVAAAGTDEAAAALCFEGVVPTSIVPGPCPL
jgi:hypothetical protein